MKNKRSSALILGQTNSGRYVNLILIILTIFIALIRRKNPETGASHSVIQGITNYTFSDIKHQSAEWSALAALLKSHDLAAEVTISSRLPNSKTIADVTRHLEHIGVPFEAYKVLGKVGNREEISVAVYKVSRTKV